MVALCQTTLHQVPQRCRDNAGRVLGRVAKRGAFDGRRHLRHGGIGEDETGAVAAENRDRREADRALGRGQSGRELRHPAAGAEQGHVDGDRPRRDLGHEHRGDRPKLLLRTAEVGLHGTRGDGGHQPALRRERSVPLRGELDLIAAGVPGIGGQRGLPQERDVAHFSPFSWCRRSNSANAGASSAVPVAFRFRRATDGAHDLLQHSDRLRFVAVLDRLSGLDVEPCGPLVDRAARQVLRVV